MLKPISARKLRAENPYVGNSGAGCGQISNGKLDQPSSLMYALSKFRYVYARKLRKAMETGNFRFVESKSYNNELGEPGIEHFWLYERRRFNFSENQTEQPSGIQDLVRILKNESGIDHNKNFWKNRNG